jgi:ABC-type Fe3+-hydroxamate transport system substrate-binding protein
LAMAEKVVANLQAELEKLKNKNKKAEDPTL